MKTKIKHLNDSNPTIFDEVAKYLLAKKKAKDKATQKIISEHFKTFRT